MNESAKDDYTENVYFRHRTYQLSKALWKMVEKDWSAWIESAGLTINEHHILISVYQHGKMKLTDLAAFGMMHVSTAVNYSKKLELAGLIQFEKDLQDKRINYIIITQAGKNLVEDLEKDWKPEESLIILHAQSLEQLFGRKPFFIESTSMIRSYYGESFMSHIESPYTCNEVIADTNKKA